MNGSTHSSHLNDPYFKNTASNYEKLDKASRVSHRREVWAFYFNKLFPRTDNYLLWLQHAG